MAYVPQHRRTHPRVGRPTARQAGPSNGAPVPQLATVHRSWTPHAHPGAYQTFGIQPYWRQATCAEVECPAYTDGWVTAVDESTDLGRRQADYIRTQSGRRFTVERTEAGWTAFRFYPGQTCFASKDHRVPWQRPELYIVRAGDHRATAGRPKVYDRPDQWADDLHTTTDRLYTARSRAGTADY